MPASLLAAALAAAALLTGCGGDDDPPPPVITTQPQAQTVQEGSAADFTVAGSSEAGALSYAWALEGGAAFSGATAPTYRIDATSLTDHGKRFVATLSNEVGSTTSSAALLSITERSWGVVRPLTQGEASGREDMAVAVDSLGTTHVATTEIVADQKTRLNLGYKGPNIDYVGSSRGLGAFNVPAGTTHQQLRLVPGSAGVVMVLWREGIADDFGNVLKAALLYNEGEGFTQLGEFTAPAANALDAQGAWVSADTFEAVYRSFDGTRWNVLTRRFTLNAQRDGGQWAAEAAVEAIDANPDKPRIASDGQGNVMVAFGVVETTSRTYVNVRPAAATAWQPAAATDVSGLDAASPAELATLAMNAQGRGVLLMRGDQTRIYMRLYDFGSATPGWQTGADYVANLWDSLPGDVWPAVVFHDGGPAFSILSVHNNGRFISRWACGSSSCGAPQTFVDAGATATVQDLRVARDAAGNYIVAYSLLQPDETLRARALRFHRGLDAWRPDGPVGEQVVEGRLELAMAADGRATLVFGTPTAQGRVPRTADFR